MELAQLIQQLDAHIDDAKSSLENASNYDELIQIKNSFLGKKGKLQSIMKFLKQLPNEGKRELGQASNRAKNTIESIFESQLLAIQEAQLLQKLQSESCDVSLPGKTRRLCYGHPIKQVEYDLINLFQQLGFDIAEGPEIESDFYNFEALNFPDDHPARDEQDTFMTHDGRLLRTHTSPVQIRTLLNYQPPIRIIAPGRVYRCDNDVTHSPVFHQVEGLFVDTSVTFKDLKGVLEAFIHQYFGPQTRIRLRSSFFPFTEPSVEVDIGCVFCKHSGCRVCSHTGWIEILGAGMVDPNVLEKTGTDPNLYSGFAFGMGIERITMLKYSISDIRFLFDGNVDFLQQF